MRPEAQAIDHVLTAERDGEARLEEERQAARGRIDEARREARRILRRAHERIRRVHARCAEALQARQELLEAEAADPAAQGHDALPDPEQIEHAVRELASHLTTLTEEGLPSGEPVSHG